MATKKDLQNILAFNLNVSVADLQKIDRFFVKKTGVAKTLEIVAGSMQEAVTKRLSSLGVNPNETTAEIVKEKLKQQVVSLNDAILKNFSQEDLINRAKILFGDSKGFFLTRVKAEDLIRQNPPRRIIRELGYETVDGLLLREDIFEIFCALRFVEEPEWLANVFFKPYYTLSREYFEHRSIQIRTLSPKWEAMVKKYDRQTCNYVSHLKELGVIFTVPNDQQMSLELFLLVLHYLFEINFYSRLFEKLSRGEHFGDYLVSALIGRMPIPTITKKRGQLIFTIESSYAGVSHAHINPEAFYWSKAEELLSHLGYASSQSRIDSFFWNGLDWVGWLFKNEKNRDEIVSFDVLDTIASISTGNQTPVKKYVHNQQEALWNKIFTAYCGDGAIESALLENFTNGAVTIFQDQQNLQIITNL